MHQMNDFRIRTGQIPPSASTRRYAQPTMGTAADERSCIGCNSAPLSPLVVIRGNSASGKSTAAAAVQGRFEHGRRAVVSQDLVRRNMVREPDEPGGFNIELIEQIARWCLARGMVVIVEGILDAQRYGPMLGRLADSVDRSLFCVADDSPWQTLRSDDVGPRDPSCGAIFWARTCDRRIRCSGIGLQRPHLTTRGGV
ncbi:hypothetical protein ACFWUP_15160 [Nocardia sp. NPDC058658]|uniref:hypothetical protein n=1 Tax=Nocardia sp. NPDC058658 TaxID=3346580 RepID=UPI00365C08C6